MTVLTHYALHISASDSAIRSMNRLHICQRARRVSERRVAMEGNTHIPSPKQPQRPTREQARLERAAHARQDADGAERDAQDAKEGHVAPELALVPELAQPLVRPRSCCISGRLECVGDPVDALSLDVGRRGLLHCGGR